MMLIKRLLVCVCFLLGWEVVASDWALIHAPTKESYTCTEHWEGQFKYLGDALGTDCVVQELVENNDRMFVKSFKNKGLENTDWYGYGKNVLAPCDCTVVEVHINPFTNQPGKMKPGQASSVIFKTQDGIHVLIAHIDKPNIKVGEQVIAGQPIAKIGNNGYSRNPHLHIAAWKDEKPLQIRFDQRTIDLKRRAEKE